MTCNHPKCEKRIPHERSRYNARFCSPNCRNKFYVTENRRKNKIRLVELFGGGCSRCGYNKCPAALQFHHSDDNKEFGISAKGLTKSFAKLVAEAEKCELLCANCHCEEHNPV